MSAENRRRNTRYPIEGTARVTGPDGSSSARVRDLCRDAMLVECDRQWPLGTSVHVAVHVADQDEPLSIQGEVIRIGSAEDGHGTMAIVFTELHPAAATWIDLFIASQQSVGGAQG